VASREGREEWCIQCVWGEGEHEGSKPLERPRYGWKDNIKIHLQEVEFIGHGLD